MRAGARVLIHNPTNGNMRSVHHPILCPEKRLTPKQKTHASTQINTGIARPVVLWDTMLRLPNAFGAQRKVQKHQSTKTSLHEVEMNVDETIGDATDLHEPPAKKIRHGKTPSTSKPEAERKRKKSASSKYDQELAAKEVKQRAIENKHVGRIKRYLQYGFGLEVASSCSGKHPQEDANNNEPMEISMKRKTQNKRPARVDWNDEPIEKIQKVAKQDDNNADEGLGSLVDLLDDISVGRKREAKPAPTTVANESNPFCRKRPQTTSDSRYLAAMKALRATVVVEEIPITAFHDFEKNLTELFSFCGSILQIGFPGFAKDTGTFNVAINFETELAAIKAEAKNRAIFGGGFIRVRRPGPLEPVSSALSYIHILPRCVKQMLKDEIGYDEEAGTFDYEEVASSLFVPQVRVHGKRVYGNYSTDDFSSESD